MSAEIVPFVPPRTIVRNHRFVFGACDTCGSSSGIVHVEDLAFGMCLLHQVYWLIGKDVFSDWRDDGADIWEQNAALLLMFNEIEPLPFSLPGSAP